MLINSYTGGSQGRLEMRRRRRMELQRAGIFEGYAFSTGPEITGGMTAADAVTENVQHINWSAVATGLATGVSVWLATRLLDRLFGITGGSK